MDYGRLDETKASTSDPISVQNEGRISTDHEQCFHPSIMKLKLKRTSSDTSGLKKAEHKIKFDFPQKSALKQPSKSVHKSASRSRSVSFSNLLLEEIVDETEIREDSDSEYEDCLTELRAKSCEKIDNEFNPSPSSQNLNATNWDFRKSQSLESLNFRPPTPPNASHLVKPVNFEKFHFMGESL